MAGGFWSAGDTNVLASRGMNQDQSGWDSLQSWYDEKAKREREAAETARKAALLKQMADEEEADRRKALGLQVRERATIAAQAQGEDPNETAPTWEEFRAKYGVQPAASADADPFAPDGTVSVVVGEEDLKRDWETRVAGAQSRTAKWQDRFKKADEIIASGLTPYITDDGEVYGSLDNAKAGMRISTEKKKKRTAEERQKQEAEASAELSKKEKELALELLRQQGYEPADIERIQKTGDLNAEIDRLREIAKTPGLDDDSKAVVQKKFDAVVGAINGSRAKLGGARNMAYVMSYKRGIEADEAMNRLDEQHAQGEDSVLGLSYDPTTILQRQANQWMQANPDADATKNPYLVRLANQTKGEFKLDDTRLKTIQKREKNATDLVLQARRWEAEADNLAVKVEKEKEAADARIKAARAKGESELEVARIKAESNEYIAALNNLGRAAVAKYAQAASASRDLGMIATFAKDGEEKMKKYSTYFSPGTETEQTNLQNALAPVTMKRGVSPGTISKDPVFSTGEGTSIGPLEFAGKTTVAPGGKGQAEIPKTPEKKKKKEKKSAALPFDPQRIATLDAMVASGKVKRSVSGDVATYSLPSGRVYNFKTR